MDSSRVVLITGCSSGIGRGLSEEFARRGYRVVATARNIEAISDLRSRGLTTHQLDVTDAAQAANVVQTVLSECGSIDILVNNAGYGLFGPSLEILEDELIAQMKTNVVAPILMARLVAPSMRRKGNGTIVNIGSVSGIVTTPFAGVYCSSKAALHALSDALRFELAPFGIRVITVQAGGIQSNFGNASAVSAARVLKADSWYAKLRDSIHARAGLSQIGAMPAGKFAAKVVSAVESSRPASILWLGKHSSSLPILRAALPTSWFDAIMRKQFGLNQLP